MTLITLPARADTATAIQAVTPRTNLPPDADDPNRPPGRLVRGGKAWWAVAVSARAGKVMNRRAAIGRVEKRRGWSDLKRK